MLNRHHSEKTKKKISNTLKGRIIFDKWREKIGKANKGFRHTKEAKEKIVKALIGRPVSKETRRKISNANKGRHLTEDQKKHVSEIQKGRHSSQEAREKNRLAHLGIRLSEETKQKISKANKGRKFTAKQIKSFLRRHIPSSLEKKFQDIINKYGLPYKYVGNGTFILGNCNPDFININNDKIAIEVYARYYKKRNYQDIDKWREERRNCFKRYGWDLIFFNEVEVNENYILKRLKNERRGK